MKICWDNLEKLRYNKKTGKWRGCTTYIYAESCKNCGEPFLKAEKSKGDFCCLKCSKSGKNNGMYGKNRVLSDYTKQLMSKAHKGKILSQEVRDKISKSNRGKKKSLEHRRKLSESKKSYFSLRIPLYDTYTPQLEWCEEVRRNDGDHNILEVRCTHCGKWFVPHLTNLINRIQVLKGQMNGECRLYCSEECKKACPLYYKSPEALMREDAVRAGRLGWLKLDREAQAELRQLVLERDNHTCQKCGSTEHLHCHHILPVAVEPLLSADIDNCITLCEQCHKEAHKNDGCKYGQLRMEVC
jgi:5-methylcytosine-specific restriction endonuclease McrA